MKSLRSEVGAVVAGQVVAVLATIVSQACLARILGPESRGSFAVCLTLATVFGVAFLPGTDRAAQYFYLSRRLSLSESTSASLFFVGIAALFGVLAGVLGIHLGMTLFQRATRGEVLFALAVLLPLTLVGVTLELQMAAERQYGRIARYAAVQGGAGLLALLALVWWAGGGVLGALAATAVGTTVLCSLYALWLRTHRGLALGRVTGHSLRLLLGYGRRYYAARVGHQLDMGAGMLVLGAIATKADVGVYAAVSLLIIRVLMLPSAVETVMMPRLAEQGEQRVDATLDACRVSGLLTLLAAVPAAVFAKWLIGILLSPEFARGAPVVWLIVPGVVALGFAGCLMSYFRITDRPQVCSLAVWSGVCVSVTLMIVLYRPMGIVGAGLAAGAGLLARAAVLVTSFSMIAGRSPLSVFAVSRGAIHEVVRLGRA